MDKISKALNKFSKKEKENVKLKLSLLFKGETKGLNIEKLVTFKNCYRLRVGNIRIIYSIKNKKIELIAVERRGEDTYK